MLRRVAGADFRSFVLFGAAAPHRVLPETYAWDNDKTFLLIPKALPAIIENSFGSQRTETGIDEIDIRQKAVVVTLIAQSPASRCRLGLRRHDFSCQRTHNGMGEGLEHGMVISVPGIKDADSVSPVLDRVAPR